MSNYENFLDQVRNLLEKLNETGEYNIYLHHIWPMVKPLNKEKGACQEAYEGIMKYGLNLRQPSIGSTLSYFGSSKELSAEKFTSYFYMREFADRHVVAYAFPKNVTIDNENVDFSTPVDYVKYGQTMPSSMVDLLYDFSLPTKYLLCGYFMDKKNDKYILDVNQNFISKKDNYNEEVLTDVKKYFYTKNLGASLLKDCIKERILECKHRVEEDPSYGCYTYPDELDY